MGRFFEVSVSTKSRTVGDSRDRDPTSRFSISTYHMKGLDVEHVVRSGRKVECIVHLNYCFSIIRVYGCCFLACAMQAYLVGAVLCRMFIVCSLFGDGTLEILTH